MIGITEAYNMGVTIKYSSKVTKTVDIEARSNCGMVTAEKFDIANVTAEDLYKLPFDEAQEKVHMMDTAQKALVLKDVQAHLDELYAYVNRFGNENYPGVDRPSQAGFLSGMQRIKHWEAIVQWLLEYDIVYKEAILLDQMDETLPEFESMYEQQAGKVDEAMKQSETINNLASFYGTALVNESAALMNKFFK